MLVTKRSGSIGFEKKPVKPAASTRSRSPASVEAVDAKPDTHREPAHAESRDGGNKVAEPETQRAAAHTEAGKDHAPPELAEILRDPSAAIAGTSFTWHDALWLNTWGRMTKASDITNAPVDTVLANIERQAQALQKLVNHLGKPIKVHCWLRPPAYNKIISKASNSAHLRGTATDFHIEGMTAEQVRQVVKTTAGLYPGAGENKVSWVHLDLEHHAWF
mgnify:CR=1 FL=1